MKLEKILLKEVTFESDIPFWRYPSLNILEERGRQPKGVRRNHEGF
jgi:hypothetical protein